LHPGRLLLHRECSGVPTLRLKLLAAAIPHGRIARAFTQGRDAPSTEEILRGPDGDGRES